MRIEEKATGKLFLMRIWIKENYMTSISFKLRIVSSRIHIYPSQ